MCPLPIEYYVPGTPRVSNLGPSKILQCIHQHPRGAAVVLIVVEDPLADGRISVLGPLVEPLDRRGA